jgi:hypothetical protein
LMDPKPWSSHLSDSRRQFGEIVYRRHLKQLAVT